MGRGGLCPAQGTPPDWPAMAQLLLCPLTATGSRTPSQLPGPRLWAALWCVLWGEQVAGRLCGQGIVGCLLLSLCCKQPTLAVKPCAGGSLVSGCAGGSLVSGCAAGSLVSGWTWQVSPGAMVSVGFHGHCHALMERRHLVKEGMILTLAVFVSGHWSVPRSGQKHHWDNSCGWPQWFVVHRGCLPDVLTVGRCCISSVSVLMHD